MGKSPSVVGAVAIARLGVNHALFAVAVVTPDIIIVGFGAAKGGLSQAAVRCLFVLLHIIIDYLHVSTALHSFGPQGPEDCLVLIATELLIA